MNKLRLKIIEYYDNLVNQIDIECEKKLSNPNLTNAKKEKLNSIRDLFFTQIDKVQQFNLKNLESLKNSVESIQENEEVYLFKDKFCLYIPKKKNHSYAKINSLGNLVITNCFVNEIVRKNLECSINCEWEDFSKMNSIDTIMHWIIRDLVWDLSTKNNNIIDVSCKEKHLIKNLHLRPIESYSQDEYKMIEQLIPTQNLTSLTLECKRMPKVDKKVLNYFSHIKELNLDFDMVLSYGKSLFKSLKNLEKLTLCKISDVKIRKTLFNGLSHLKDLRIIDGEICTFENKTFLQFPNLENLTLEENQIITIRKSHFEGLENLKSLSLARNEITPVPNDVFNVFKNLKCLNLHWAFDTSQVRAEVFNGLDNLEFLALLPNENEDYWIDLEQLQLPKLKFLACQNYRVPKFKNMKLNFLHITGLKCLDEDSFEDQPDLTGLLLQFDCDLFESIVKENFECLKKLSFLGIYFYYMGNLYIDRLTDDQEYYKEFLCKNETFVRSCLTELQYFEVSNYENISEYFQNELDVDEHTKKVVTEYHENHVSMDLFMCDC